MDIESEHVDLLRLAAGKLKGEDRRVFVAEVTLRLCDGKERLAEDRFGGSRQMVRKGLEQLRTGQATETGHHNGGRKRFEDRHPKMAQAIRDIAEPKTQADPELKSQRQYLNLSAAEVRKALADRGWNDDDIPPDRSMRRILNRMNFRLKKIRKGRPLKKNENTDAIFENVQAVKAASRDAPETLEISADTKAKVAIGDYSRGGKNTDRI